MVPPLDLSQLDQLASAIAQAKDLQDITALRAQAETARRIAQSSSLGLRVENRAAELRLRAERRAGKILGKMKLRGGDRKSKLHRASLKLSQFRILPNQSSRWQRLASVDDNQFEQYIENANHLGHRISSRGLLRFWRLDVSSDKEPGKPRYLAREGRQANSSGNEPSNNGLVRANIQELSDHRRLLHIILAPYCTGEQKALMVAQKRLVLRLLCEMEDLVNGL